MTSPSTDPWDVVPGEDEAVRAWKAVERRKEIDALEDELTREIIAGTWAMKVACAVLLLSALASLAQWL